MQIETLVERAPDHSQVLLVTGRDLFPRGVQDANTMVLEKLRSAVAEGETPPPGGLVSPVRPGTHDFWIVYSVGATGAANAGIQDEDATPRPLRGGVVAKAPPTTHDDTTVINQLTTLLQEVGHYWLAYPSLKFAWRGHDVSYELADWDKFNRDQIPDGPLLGGRLLQHWGPWFHSENSPLGGRNWSTVSRDGIFDRWQWEHLLDGPQPQPSGLPALTLDNKFSDLDLLVMGAKTPDQCYPETDGRFRFLEPSYVVQPRFLPGHDELGWPFLAGVFVAYNKGDFIYFGFDGDHRQLGVYRTDRSVRLGGPTSLGSAYTPGWLPNSGVALRVVRQGRRLHFQARLDGTALGLRVSPPDHNVFVAAPPGTIPGLFDGISATGTPASHPDFTAFHTVATVDERRDPVAIGLIALTAWPTLLDAVFHNLETLTVPPVLSRRKGARATHHLVPLPKHWPTGGAFADLPVGQLRLHLPAGAQDPPQVQDWHGRLRLLLPYDVAESEGGVTFDHTDSIDQAPKVLLKAPSGNFAFGTTAAVRRTLYPRYSGGGAYPTAIWGHTRTLDIHDVRLPTSAAAARKAPPRRTYKTAFIIAARQRSDITDAMIDSVDTIRRYWDPSFAAVTDGQRRSSSTLT